MLIEDIERCRELMNTAWKDYNFYSQTYNSLLENKKTNWLITISFSDGSKKEKLYRNYSYNEINQEVKNLVYKYKNIKEKEISPFVDKDVCIYKFKNIMYKEIELLE